MNGFSSFIENSKKLWPSKLIREGALNTRLLLLGILGVILLLIGSVYDGQMSKNNIDKPSEMLKTVPVPSVNRSYEEVLEAKMSNLLSQVRGAGSVAVSITLESSATQEHAKNIVKETRTIQEKDTTGGIRTTVETKENQQILLGKENSVDKPVMVREVKPIIKGVLVIAEGAYDSSVKANLTKAVEAGLGIPSYKITVLPQRK
ncbi:MAG: hypothetical protein GX348_03060 [Veillonellaceae bacterium]|jgi:stage III sporulation protein AG|nr:hypothetical protein [Veillonellaceae bacterium]